MGESIIRFLVCPRHEHALHLPTSCTRLARFPLPASSTPGKSNQPSSPCRRQSSSSPSPVDSTSCSSSILRCIYLFGAFIIRLHIEMTYIYNILTEGIGIFIRALILYIKSTDCLKIQNGRNRFVWYLEKDPRTLQTRIAILPPSANEKNLLRII